MDFHTKLPKENVNLNNKLSYLKTEINLLSFKSIFHQYETINKFLMVEKAESIFSVLFEYDLRKSNKFSL